MEYPYDVTVPGEAKPLRYPGNDGDLHEGKVIVVEHKQIRITKIIRGARGASPGPPMGSGEIGKAEGVLLEDLWETKQRELRKQSPSDTF
jgi:hypothetical protein